MALRRFASWLASPLAYPSLQVARQTRCRVLLGPFEGLRYPFGFLPQGSFAGPQQAGTYESELHQTVEGIVTAAPEVLVNVGAAEGYYAVGLARRLPSLEVIAYEADARLREFGERLCRLNGVESRIEWRGECTAAELAALDDRLNGRSVCVLMDCEGCEAELADPAAVQWLRDASLLVELHTAIDGEIETRLEQRLAPSHETAAIRARPPWASQWPALMKLRGLRQIDRELLVAEFRHGGQDWLWATPRQPGQ